MKWADIQAAIRKLKFPEKKDKGFFEEELRHLLEENNTKHLIKLNTINALRDLYLMINAETTALDVSILKSVLEGNTSSRSLLDYFLSYINEGGVLPGEAGAVDAFFHLCNRNIDKNILLELLKTNLLSFYKMNDLLKLKYFYVENLKTLTSFYDKYEKEHSTENKNLALNLLHILYPTILDEESPDDLHYFIINIVPMFEKRFAHRFQPNALREYIHRFAEWFMLWLRYDKKEEEGLEADDEYYDMEFETIVKYITEFIWWKNGLYYRNGDKNFYYGSPGFFHLAKGGSIRKAPDQRHYTRRMAKVFVNIPYDFDQTDKDMYLYCYCKSLNAGDRLTEALQRFIRHHQQIADLNQELESWNPVIQKLATPEFEELVPAQINDLLGYLYHCLRDKPDFTVQRRTLRHLLRDSEAYYLQIQERAIARQQRAAEPEPEAVNLEQAYLNRQLDWRAMQRLNADQRKRLADLEQKWEPHSKIKPMTIGGDYKIEELTSKQELNEEGYIMNHCVGTYALKCRRKECSIWSLRQFKNNKWYSLVTIEVDRRPKIIQSAARFNATPSATHQKMIERWARNNSIHF